VFYGNFFSQLNTISDATEKHGVRVLRFQKLEVSMLHFFSNRGCFSLRIVGCRLGNHPFIDLFIS